MIRRILTHLSLLAVGPPNLKANKAVSEHLVAPSLRAGSSNKLEVQQALTKSCKSTLIVRTRGLCNCSTAEAATKWHRTSKIVR